MRIKNGLLSLTGIVFGLFLSSAALSTDKQPSGTKKQRIQYEFAITADHAKISHISGDKYKLEITQEKLNSVLVFTDRPYRSATRLTPAQYVKFVSIGPDSFNSDPPNVVVTFSSNKSTPFAYKLVDSHRTKTGVLYNLQLLKGGQGQPKLESMQGKLSLFIDAMISEAECAEPQVSNEIFPALYCVSAYPDQEEYDEKNGIGPDGGSANSMGGASDGGFGGGE
jgi:hypothetical protein